MSDRPVPSGNIHTHHLIGKYIPDKIFKQQVGNYSKFLSDEWFVKNIIGFPLLRPLVSLFAGSRAVNFLRLLRAEDISLTRKVLLKEMCKAGIDYSVVVLLNYSFAATPCPGEELVPYDRQMREIAESCVKEPFRFFLFAFFDPRRKDAMQNLREAYEKFGVVGIKIYPALGYHPQPGKTDEFFCADPSLLDPNQTPGERLQMVADHLKSMYEFAESKDLPIMTHCGPGGSYMTLVDDADKERLCEYCCPDNYLEIVEKYNLRICLAHMGGKRFEDEKSMEWYEKICSHIKTAQQGNGFKGRIYTDQSYDLSNIIDDLEKRDFYVMETARDLEDEILGRYMLFGSDWPMGMYKYTEKKYTKAYRKRLSDGQQQKYFKDNPARFLFGESKKIPGQYIDFIKTHHGGTVPELPPWVREDNGSYYLI